MSPWSVSSKIAVAIGVALALVVCEPDAMAEVGPAQAVDARPQLLIFHGGSFLYNDPSFRERTDPLAKAAGFVPHYVAYPLGNMPAALAVAQAEARRLARRYGLDHVYAYGSSAGGDLAALLSGEGLVTAAVAKAPPSDLVDWRWPLFTYGPAYFTRIGLNPEERYRLSPMRRPALRPLLVIQGRSDDVVPPVMNEMFAAKFGHVRLWVVPGGHWTERTHPEFLERAFRWLAQVGALKPRSHAREVTPWQPTPSADSVPTSRACGPSRSAPSCSATRASASPRAASSG